MSSKKVRSQEYSYTVIYEWLKEGGYQVAVPILPGLVTYGRTLEEARRNAREAILCHIEGLQKAHESIPQEENLFQERVKVSALSV